MTDWKDRVKYEVNSREELDTLEEAMGNFFQAYGVELSAGRLKVKKSIDNWVGLSPEAEGFRITQVMAVTEPMRGRLKSADSESVLINLGKYNYHVHYDFTGGI